MSIVVINPEIEKIVMNQVREIVESSPTPQYVTCACGKRLKLYFTFRCLYCGVYYCQGCAEKHFGKTREDYKQERIASGEITSFVEV